ncbi:amino acid adenylation domain-containing protein [Paenibacillus silvae]|uniref:amino acid adenylation domain-containing protein n=1 Tax=Paenibacillus silvae TaxID=1325358 RepID=UPI003CE85827
MLKQDLSHGFNNLFITNIGIYCKKAYTAIESAAEQPYYPLSSAQKRLYLVREIEGEGVSYNMPVALRVEGPLELKQLHQAFQALMNRHEVLRTSFALQDGELVQQIHSSVEVPYLVQKVSSETEVREHIQAFIRPFDLQQAPLFRAGVLQLATEEHIVLWDTHHIISDGLSSVVLQQELVRLYEGESLEAPVLQYKDYAVWEQEQLHSGAMEAAGEYWKAQFAGEVPILDFPTDYTRPAIQQFAGDYVSFELSEELSQRLIELSKMQGVTLYMTLLAAYQVLLSKYTGQEDIVVGTPVAGRPQAELEKTVGMFVHTLALRSMPAGEKSFSAYLSEVKEQVLQAFVHQAYPLEELIEHVSVQRDLSRNPLFDTVFVLQNFERQAMEVPGLKLTPYAHDFKIAKFDLTLQMIERGTHLGGRIEYSSHLFRAETMERLTHHWVQLLEAIVEQPGSLINELEIVTAAEKEQLLHAFNDTKTTYPAEKTIVQLFEEQVSRTPEQVAVVYEEESVTYDELNQRANQLARVLVGKGVGPEKIVGILVDRSVEMIVGILGILKAGGAYLPIDPEQPVERINYILDNSGLVCLLTRELLINKLVFSGEIITLNNLNCNYTETSNLKVNIINTNLAYVIYTSGTTGNPKGVMIEHRQVNYLLEGLYNLVYQKYSNSLNIALVAPIYFDASVKQIFASLLLGHSLYIVPRDSIINPNSLANYYRKYQIAVTDGTPAHLSLLSNAENLKDIPLHHMLIGGEALSYSIVHRLISLFEKNGHVPTILNVYGPTETCVDATAYEVQTNSKLHEQIKIIPIGTPLDNCKIYILNQYQQLQPIGIQGEIYIAGDGVSRGYLNQPHLTEEKFIKNPFMPEGNMYRTGDIARWLPDGSIQYLGRSDHQVKIRGYRIELGEIEAAFSKINNVQQVIVTTYKQHDEHLLCAYFVASEPISNIFIKNKLLEVLPSYMIPSYFVQMDQLPVTVNGKVDRRALPKPERKYSGTDYVAPRTPTEKKLAEIWSSVLGIEQIGAQDHFFDIGGHSLKAMMLVSRIHKEFQVEFPLKEIFAYPTLEELARYIEGGRERAYTAIEPAAEQPYYPLSSAQKRLYLVREIEGEGVSYNMPVALRVEGPLELKQLHQAFQALVNRHEVLRTSFALQDGELVQQIHSSVEVPYLVQKVSSETEVREHIQAFIRPFDLQQAPLFRAGVLQLATEEHIVLWDTHHIISDGLSSVVLQQELVRLYQGESLEAPVLQYKDYAVWEQEQLHSGAMEAAGEYWKAQFAGEVPILDFPTDYTRPAIQQFAGDYVSFELSEELSQRLIELSKMQGVTLYMTLLAAYQVLLSKYTGQEDIVVGTPVAGRPQAELEKTVGMFVHTLALRSMPAGEKSFSAYLSEVKEQVLQAFVHQAYPLEELVEHVSVQRDLSRNPLFDTVFVLQNFERQAMEVPGLKLTPYAHDFKIAKFDLTLQMIERGTHLGGQIEYSSHLFRAETMERLTHHWMQLLEAIVEQPGSLINELEIVTAAEKEQLLHAFNDTKTTYPAEKTIVQLFEEQVSRTPEQVAVVYEEESVTYDKLNQRANQLARVLVGKGVGPEKIVGILVDRSVEMIVGILGILKAGGAYLPIDPAYPEDRIEFMLNDSGTKVLLTQGHLPGAQAFRGEVIDLMDRGLYEGEADALPVQYAPDHLAYIIYTSGSTGTPKGVMVEHRNVVRLLCNDNNRFDFSEQDVWTMFHSYCFDFSVWEMYGALLYGGKLVVVPSLVAKDPRAFVTLLSKQQVTILNQTPTSFYQVSTVACSEGAAPLRVRKVIFGGEALSPIHLKPWKEKYPETQLINMYGITETTVHVTYKEITAREIEKNESNIGQPIPTLEVYVLNEQGNLAPIGIPGEMYVSGDGITRGYLNREDLTAQRFISNPFVAGKRMYKTGDAARWLPDGNLEYIGRIDNQVKIRGYRIEPSEIAEQLLTHEQVTEAEVIARKTEEGNAYLCAYVVSAQPEIVLELRSYLAQKLPDYMIPAYFMQLEKFPVTANGKLDTKSLPAPEGNVLKRAEYVAPRNEVERQVVSLWEKLLEVKPIGVHDSYFDLGGDSIKAIRVISSMNTVMNWNIQIKDLYSASTIEQLCKAIKPKDDKLEQKKQEKLRLLEEMRRNVTRR